jgi:NAD(P)-dependent dehydrogenase (short-subunit alcohol dehydrogenase family)
MGALDGYSAVVTGGGSGIGRGIVERFVAEGASVVAVDRVKDRVDELAAKHPGKVVGVEANVASYADNAKAVAAAVDNFGKLDVFVGNAGIWDFSASTRDTEPEKLASAFDELFSVNVKGYLLGAKAALDELTKTEGNIIFTTSNAGWWPAGGGPIYTSSKHAVVGLIHQLAFEFFPVRVNGVAPGGTLTDLRGTEALGEADRSFGNMLNAMRQNMGESAPRMTMPEEHAPAYVFLASRESRHTNATIIDSTDAMLTQMFRRARMAMQRPPQ